jgi:DegV family protein with EDD domain
MRIGIVVDSGCDLPRDFIDEHQIRILPITIQLQTQKLVDQRDPQLTAEFYKRHVGTAGDAETEAFSPEQIKDLFLSRLVIDYDFVFCLTLASTRSLTFENATKASLRILNEYKPIRAKAGIAGPFALRVIDSQSLFAATGVLAVECVRQMKSGQTNPNKIRERLEQLTQHLHGYMIPQDLMYLRTRAKKKGDRSVGLVSAFLGSALDIKPLLHGYRNQTEPVAKLRGFDEGCRKMFAFLVQRVKKGLLAPQICVSYGGDLAVMRKLPGYQDLRDACQVANVEVYESMMSMTGGVNVGEGAICVGLAAEPHEVELK